MKHSEHGAFEHDDARRAHLRREVGVNSLTSLSYAFLSASAFARAAFAAAELSALSFSALSAALVALCSALSLGFVEWSSSALPAGSLLIEHQLRGAPADTSASRARRDQRHSDQHQKRARRTTSMISARMRERCGANDVPAGSSSSAAASPCPGAVAARKAPPGGCFRLGARRWLSPSARWTVDVLTWTPVAAGVTVAGASGPLMRCSS